MRGLRSIGWRELTRRRLRYTLTALGIVLGVANVFGVLVTNATTNRTVDRRANDFAGGADVAASSNDGSVPFTPAVLDRLRNLPQTRSVAVLWQAFDVDSVKDTREFYALGGADDVARREILPARLVRGRMFEAGKSEAVVSERAARRLHLRIGGEWRTDLRRFVRGVKWDEVGMLMKLRPGAPRMLHFKITGIISEAARGLSYPYTSYTSLEYIWSVMEPKLSTEVRFFLDDGVDAAAWASDRTGEFQGVNFETGALTADFKRFLYVLQGAMSGSAAIAVFVGAFLIYLTFSMSVVERTRVLGMLHAVGSTPRQVARAVVTEALVLGCIATAAGLALGALLSLGLLRLVANVVRVDVGGLTVPPVAVALGIGVGLVATLAGALAPARRAARLSPVEAIRASRTAAVRPSRAWIAGVALFASGVGISLGTRGIAAASLLAQLATLGVLFGAVLLVPPLLAGVVRVGRRGIARLTGRLGDVALMHLVRERSRSAYTLGLVMVVLAMMLALTATSGSAGRAVDTWVDKRFGADLLAYKPAPISVRSERAVAAVPAVAAVTSVGFGQTRITAPRSMTSNLVLIDPVKFFDVAGFPWARGDDASAKRGLRAGGHVLLPAALAQQLHLKPGSRMTLATRQGPAPFEVAATYASLGSGNEIGIVASSYETKRFFIGERRNVLYMNLKPGAQRRAAVAAIDAALVKSDRPTSKFSAPGPDGVRIRSGYFFVAGADIKAEARRNVRSYFSLFYAVLFVAVIVGLLGLANTMATSVLQRYREIGVLGAVGASPGDLGRMVLAESSVLVGVAFVLSLVLGTLLARLLVDGVARIVGFGIGFVFPWRWLPILALMAALTALVAAVVPARRAARLSPVEALRYE